MKHFHITYYVFFIYISSSFAQTIPSIRTVNWSLAGLKNEIPNYNTIVNINDHGGIANGLTSNNLALTSAINALNNLPGVIYFEEGIYVFDATINLPDNLILRGKGADSTTLKFVAPATGDLIKIGGTIDNQKHTTLIDASKNQNHLVLSSNHNILAGDYIHLTLDDQNLITSSWATRTVGQIIEIESVSSDTLFLSSPLRLDYPTSLNPWITKMNPRKNVGIECLKILRGTNDSYQSNNISFEYAVESWMKGIESDSCNYAHIAISNSSNIEIRNSYFHDAYSYGNGGKGYGVMIHLTSNECLVENNIFKHLRHSMILQAGANANVFGYNYSIDPYWTEVSLPANSAGDLCLHGNYTYSNLFEGNIGQQIVIDDSHGKNGPYNTFFRNRLDLYGIFMNNNPASDSQNIVGNEVTNTGFTYGLNLIFGTDHFLHGNNIKGTINPTGTNLLSDSSYYLNSKPTFLNQAAQFPLIGTPTIFKSGENAAKTNFDNGKLTYCHEDLVSSLSIENKSNDLKIYPNPTKGIIHIDNQKSQTTDYQIEVYNSIGEKIHSTWINDQNSKINIEHLPTGFYFIDIKYTSENVRIKVIKQYDMNYRKYTYSFNQMKLNHLAIKSIISLHAFTSCTRIIPAPFKIAKVFKTVVPFNDSSGVISNFL